MILFVYNVSAQKDFQGTITYGLDYIELPAQMEGMEGMLPKEMSVTIKGDLSRIDQSLGMGMRQTSIVDQKNNTIVMLMDMMGQKMKMEMPLDEMDEKEKKKKSDIKIDYVDGEKEIAGFKCKKALISSKGQDGEVEVYYTEELPGSASREFEGLKGYPLEFGRNQQGMSIRISATKVDQSKVDDSKFETPDGYTDMDPAMIEKMMGG